jgi:hypothetical protein
LPAPERPARSVLGNRKGVLKIGSIGGKRPVALDVAGEIGVGGILLAPFSGGKLRVFGNMAAALVDRGLLLSVRRTAAALIRGGMCDELLELLLQRLEIGLGDGNLGVDGGEPATAGGGDLVAAVEALQQDAVACGACLSLALDRLAGCRVGIEGGCGIKGA